MLQNKKFLIIDDFNTEVSIVRTMLNDAHIKNDDIDNTSDSMKAIRLLASHKYDVVLCDYNMNHHIDGGLIFDEIKQRKLMSSSAVFICISGDNSEAVVTHLIELELDDFILKPFCFATLIKRIKKVVSRKTVLSTLLEAVEEKKYELGLDLCANFKEIYPEYGGYIDRIHGDCLLRLKRHKEARGFYEKVCENTRDIWPQIGLAQSLQGLGDIDEAEFVFSNILAKYPKQPLARKGVAHCLMEKEEISQALVQFNILHKINPANPLRELVIANLYAAIQEYKKAAFGYDKFVMKVAGTNRYNHGIAVSVSVSLLLASLYTDDNEERSDLLSEARNNLCDLSVSIVDSTLDVEIGFGILACMEGDIKSCFLVANKIKKDISEVTSFYTALNIAKLYSFCGMSSLYEKAVSQARNICGQTDDDVLMLSLVKLLESSSKVIKQRYENGEKLISKAFAHRQKNKANLAISEAYQAFWCLLV